MKRLLNLIKGFFGMFLSGMEKNNPEALLENEKENLRKQISAFNTGLARHAGNIEKDLATTKELRTEEADLRKKLEQLIRGGKRETAATFAVRLQKVTQDLAAVMARLTESETQYKQLTAARDLSVKAAKDKIEKLSFGLNDMKMKKASAELTEMGNSLISGIGSGGDNLNRLSEMIEEERNTAAGRVRVAQETGAFQELQANAAVDADLAEIALADFEASMGITSATTETPAPVQKVMG